MADQDDLRERLQAISDRIQEASDKLDLHEIFHKDHIVTSDELRKRQLLLADLLNKEVADLESHGHAVSSLEKSLLMWLNKLSFDR